MSVMENLADTDREAEFMVQIPETAFISNFTMLVNDELFIAEIKGTHSFMLLPPANEVCEGYVFTDVCLSRGGGCLPLVWGCVCLPHTPRQTPPIPWADLPSRHPPGQTPTLGRLPPGRHLPAQCMLGYTPLPSACWDTHTPPPARCMLGYGQRGRYASHWNVFLFLTATKTTNAYQ